MANLAEQKVRKELGQNIKLLRSKMGKTQDELSSDLKITQKYLGHLEQGARSPSLTLIVKIARELSVEVWELFKN